MFTTGKFVFATASRFIVHQKFHICLPYFGGSAFPPTPFPHFGNVMGGNDRLGYAASKDHGSANGISNRGLKASSTSPARLNGNASTVCNRFGVCKRNVNQSRPSPDTGSHGVSSMMV